jgi:hypothetical protein
MAADESGAHAGSPTAAVFSPKERKAMRRAVPGAAVAHAKQGISPRSPSDVTAIGDGESPRSMMALSPAAASAPSSLGAEALGEQLHGMRHYIVRRHKNGAISLHRALPSVPSYSDARLSARLRC